MHFDRFMAHMGRALALATDVLNANMDFVGNTSYHVEGARQALRDMRRDGPRPAGGEPGVVPAHPSWRANQCQSVLHTFVQGIGLAAVEAAATDAILPSPVHPVPPEAAPEDVSGLPQEMGSTEAAGPA